MKNPKITIQKTELLPDNWFVLNKVTYTFELEDKPKETRENMYLSR